MSLTYFWTIFARKKGVDPINAVICVDVNAKWTNLVVLSKTEALIGYQPSPYRQSYSVVIWDEYGYFGRFGLRMPNVIVVHILTFFLCFLSIVGITRQNCCDEIYMLQYAFYFVFLFLLLLLFIFILYKKKKSKINHLLLFKWGIKNVVKKWSKFFFSCKFFDSLNRINSLFWISFLNHFIYFDCIFQSSVRSGKRLWIYRMNNTHWVQNKFCWRKLLH